MKLIRSGKGAEVWTDLTADPEAAIATAHRSAAEHDKPEQRGGAAGDEWLRVRRH